MTVVKRAVQTVGEKAVKTAEKMVAKRVVMKVVSKAGKRAD